VHFSDKNWCAEGVGGRGLRRIVYHAQTHYDTHISQTHHTHAHTPQVLAQRDVRGCQCVCVCVHIFVNSYGTWTLLRPRCNAVTQEGICAVRTHLIFGCLKKHDSIFNGDTVEKVLENAIELRYDNKFRTPGLSKQNRFLDPPYLNNVSHTKDKHRRLQQRYRLSVFKQYSTLKWALPHLVLAGRRFVENET